MAHDGNATMFIELGETFEDFYLKRREQRLSTEAVTLPIEVTAEDHGIDGKLSGRMLDISVNGLGFVCHVPLNLHSKILLHSPELTELGLDPLVAWVVWCEHVQATYRVGVRFGLTQEGLFRHILSRIQSELHEISADRSSLKLYIV